jgi:hypothetical protein
MYEALDIETIWDNNIAKPICIAITCGDKIHFKKISVDKIDSLEIINFMLEKCSSKKIYYVHNLTFEIFVFLRYLVENNTEFKIISSNKTVYSAEIWNKNKKIRLRCSYRLTMLSLKKLARLAEIEEKGIFPYKILDQNLKENMIIKSEMFENIEDYNFFLKEYGENINTYDVLEKYCKNDVNITKKSIIKFWKIIEENGLQNNNRILTAAKLSIENYFLNNKKIKKKINIKYDRLIRKGYFGGRTEVFGNPYENEILLHYDWSGMYAQCMSEKILGGEVFESEIINDLNTPGFYWIEFTQNLEFPILPIKKDKLLFANGKFEGWYWFEEILLAIKHGVKIIKVKKTISCQYYDYFIKDFVEINNKIREISPLHKQIGKNNNNTLYGRFGMDPNRLEEEIISNLNNLNNYEKVVEINGAYIGYKKKEKSISNVLVSASITSKARIKLYNGMIDVVNKGGRIMYVDTDSIVMSINKYEYKSFLDVKIGEVYFDSNKDDTIIIDAVFAAPKTYALKFLNNKEIVKIKGFNVKPSFNKFKEAFYNKGDIITKNIEWNKKHLMIKNIEREKKTNLNSLDKRTWKEDMKKTIPLTIQCPVI